VIVKTGRFGQITVADEEIITLQQGLLGFPQYTKFCLYDAGDETLILWLQSLDEPQIAFPVLEPKIFKPDYAARLSAMELRELKLDNINQSAVFSILTIPADVTQMTANLKAPIVINLKERIARQVVLQENEYNIRHPMFRELRQHLVTLSSQRAQSASSGDATVPASAAGAVVAIHNIPPSLTVKPLHP
jgi:flagellar assembly factor FliW